MIRTVTVFLTVFVLMASAVNALGCYLDKDSAIYCSDVTLNEALTEAEYTNESLDNVYLYSSSCSEVEECQLVICKDTCTMSVRGLCDYGVATKDSCATGCCQTEESCTEMNIEMDCIVQAKAEGTEMYSYTPGTCDCGVVTDLEIVEKDEVEYVASDDPLIYYIPEVIEQVQPNTTKLETIDGEPVSFPYVPLALAAVLVFLYFALRGSAPKTVYHKKPNAITVKIPPKRYKPRQPARRKHYVAPITKQKVPRVQQPKQTKDSLNAIERFRRTEELRAILRRKRN